MESFYATVPSVEEVVRFLSCVFSMSYFTLPLGESVVSATGEGLGILPRLTGATLLEKESEPKPHDL
jgi:hypothetical protein